MKRSRNSCATLIVWRLSGMHFGWWLKSKVA